MPQLNTYKYWDYNDRKMYDVTKLVFDPKDIAKYVSAVRTENGIKREIYKDIKKGVLIPSTGLMTNQNEELYDGDIVVCYYMEQKAKPRVVIWDNGWRVAGSSTEEFKKNVGDLVFKVGNMYENDSYYKIFRKNMGLED